MVALKVRTGGSEEPGIIKIRRFDELITLQLRYLVISGAIIKKCRNCGRYFIAARPNNDFCPRILDGSPAPCFMVGPKKKYAEHVENDVIMALYGKIYRRQQARKRRGTLSPDEFEKWRIEARQRIDDVKNQTITEDEFITWINASS